MKKITGLVMVLGLMGVLALLSVACGETKTVTEIIEFPVEVVVEKEVVVEVPVEVVVEKEVLIFAYSLTRNPATVTTQFADGRWDIWYAVTDSPADLGVLYLLDEEEGTRQIAVYFDSSRNIRAVVRMVPFCDEGEEKPSLVCYLNILNDESIEIEGEYILNQLLPPLASWPILHSRD